MLTPSSPPLNPSAHPGSVPDCLLTLAAPSTLEEELLDALLALPDWVPGFTVMRAQGMGRHVELASPLEKVQGRARRVMVQVAMHQQDISPLLDTLRNALPTPQLAYWVVPLLSFGRFGDTA